MIDVTKLHDRRQAARERDRARERADARDRVLFNEDNPRVSGALLELARIDETRRLEEMKERAAIE